MQRDSNRDLNTKKEKKNLVNSAEAKRACYVLSVMNNKRSDLCMALEQKSADSGCRIQDSGGYCDASDERNILFFALLLYDICVSV